MVSKKLWTECCKNNAYLSRNNTFQSTLFELKMVQVVENCSHCAVTWLDFLDFCQRHVPSTARSDGFSLVDAGAKYTSAGEQTRGASLLCTSFQLLLTYENHLELLNNCPLLGSLENSCTSWEHVLLLQNGLHPATRRRPTYQGDSRSLVVNGAKQLVLVLSCMSDKKMLGFLTW